MESRLNSDPGPTPHAPDRSAVFHTRLTPEAVVGHGTCPACGAAVPYHLEDVGSKLTCPRCRADGVRIGRSLVEADAAGLPLAPAPAFGVLLVAPRRRRRTLASLVGLGLAAAALAGSLAFTPSRELLLYHGWLNWETVETRTARPATGTADVVGGETPLAPPDITREAIEELPRADDLRASLVQAQVWQQMLRDYGVAESDPRLRRLAELIQQWTQQFRVKPGPPPVFFAEFRQAIEALREAIMAEDLARARQALERTEALFQAHTDALAAYSRSYLLLKNRFSQLELRQEGRTRIRDLLTQAGGLLKQEHPLEAAETIAQAMFLALRTPMENDEFEERNRTVQQLHRELRFARGKRAVLEAERCNQEGDVKARDSQLRVAMDLLPDLPGDRVASLLKRAGALTNKKVTDAVESDLGREIQFRTAYEEALNSYGRRGALVELAERSVQAHELLQQAASLRDQYAGKVADLILNALAAEVGDLLTLPSQSPDVAPGLALCRESLYKAMPWKQTPRWRAIDESLNAKGDEVAARAIADATRRHPQDVQAAVRLIEPALTLGGARSRASAERLWKQWQAEIAHAADRAAQEEAWKDMAARFQQGQVLDVWCLLDDFTRRFPQSPRNQQIAAIRGKIRAAVDRAVAARIREIDAYRDGRQWPEFREAVVQLEAVPLTTDQQAKLSEYQAILERNRTEAERLWYQTRTATYRLMTNPEDTLTYIAGLRTILRLYPDHEEADSEAERARARARALADGFLIQARRAGPKNAQKYREHLNTVLKLDPDGRSGKEAATLLANLTAGTASP